MDLTMKVDIKKYLDLFKVDINQYTKEDKKIGSGGYGTVYKMKNNRTNNIFAGKIIECETKEDCQSVINKEIAIMCIIQHPTFIKFIGYSVEEDTVTIIMEYAQNQTLYYHLDEARKGLAKITFSNTTRQIILIGIARGMRYLHHHNIYHCDLKSSNILLDEDFYPKITDFGLSRIHDFNKSEWKTEHNIGTIQYMSPEFIEDGLVTEKVDVYAFGILMFEVVTDQIPYPELAKKEITEYKLKKEVIKNNKRPQFDEKLNIKKSIKNLITSCWAKDINDRPTFIEIFDKLSGKNNSDVNDEEDNYFLDGVDVDQIEMYVEDICKVEDEIESLKDKYKELMKENKKLKDDFDLMKQERNLLKKSQTFSSFNNLPLKTQQFIVSDMYIKSQFLNKLDNLMQYLLQKSPEESLNFISIEKANKVDQLLTEKDENITLNILSNAIECLFSHKLITNSGFVNLLKEFKSISIEIKYPSDSFEEIYSSVVDLKRSHFSNQNQFKIALLVNSINFNDNQFYNNKEINILRISNSVTSIKSNNKNGFFEGCANLTQISIPSSVTFIGKNSFKGCSSLSQISIPSSVEQIESFAFSKCPSLYNVSIPSTTKIKDSVFDGCISISLSNEMNSIPDHCFSKSTNLRQVFIPSSINEICSYAFEGCVSITTVFIPPSVTKISFYAFADCTKLEQIFIPSSVKIIGNFAFNGCFSLKKCDLSPEIQEIGNFIFSGCSSLEEIEIPSKVKSIGNFAFSGCSSIEKIELPDSVESIGNYSFGDCSSLKSILIPSSVNSIDYEAFEGCESLKEARISRSASYDKSCFPENARLIFID